ncbi:MAG: hypothetical protein FJY29_03565 [Betaproteobacteria bacterium]|nr:hypothetical protein [Betaproteobacteria bacterium]
MGRTRQAKTLSITAALLGFAVLTGCVVPSSEPMQRTSLFGGSSRAQRSLPLPPASAMGTQSPALPGKALSNMDNIAPSGTILPQLSGALAGNSSNGGFTQPLVASPLLFQRLDKNTWRVATTAPQLFQTVAKILSQSYIISRADRQTLSMSTEWDKFFIDGRLFRNRISINVFPYNQRASDLVIKNNIEYYTQTAQKVDENDPTQWLPTQDVTDELERILDKTQKQLMAHSPGAAVRSN